MVRMDDSLMIDKEDLLIIGSYLLVTGTFLSAVGESSIDADDRVNIRRIRDGNFIQAIANSFHGVGRTLRYEKEEELVSRLEIIGAYVQVGGNSLNYAAANASIPNPTPLNPEVVKLDALGSVVQSIGAAIEVAGVVFEENGSLYENKAFGNLLISIGTLIDAIAIITPEEKEKPRRILLATGGWIEFTGSVIEAYAIIQNINEKKATKNKYNYRNQALFK
ncbi:hypothetical protein AB1L07_05245 [Niallia alba]|uniref:DUF6944 family repetitive protein n=1 Tax=Niallia alba TaxID=2729105 RepID=UPI0039A39058